MYTEIYYAQKLWKLKNANFLWKLKIKTAIFIKKKILIILFEVNREVGLEKSMLS